MQTHTFVTPTKRIESPQHVKIFGESTACRELLAFLEALARAVRGTRMTDTDVTEVSIV